MARNTKNHTLGIQIHRSGFTLVELSVALVILGLLTGGIIAGQSLIRSAELRSIITKYNSYSTAVSTFQEEYLALPGDMRNATVFWGERASTTSACVIIVPTDAKTCNGDGDGRIGEVLGGDTNQLYHSESHLFWQHLNNAGLVEGKYTGASTISTNYKKVVIGVNAPAGKMANSGFSTSYSTGSGWTFNTFKGNTLIFGTDGDGGYTWFPLLTPPEAWKIDKKIDDGEPAYGYISVFDSGATGGHGATCTGSNVPDEAEYDVSLDSKACVLLLKL